MLRRTSARRVGFTLIEMIVVIAIIAILLSLTTAAVMKVLGKGPEADTASRLDTVSSSVTRFGGDQSLGAPKYIPAGQVDMNPYVLVGGVPDPTKPNPTFGQVIAPFRLRSSYPKAASPSPDRNALDENCFEAQYIARLFNQADLQNLTGPGGPAIDAKLNANQTLTFFLNGIQVPDGSGAVTFVGFSNNKKYPFAPKGTATEDRKGPFMQNLERKRYTTVNGYAELIDAWGNPVAYFSAYNEKSGTMSGYNPYPGGPVPYVSGKTFVNEKTFQLISAGKDGKFTPPAAVLASPANGDWSKVDPNCDDWGNFSPRRLGAGPTN